MNNRFVLNLILTTGLFAAPLSAQVCLNWELSDNTSQPSPAFDFPMAYDSDRQVVVARDGACCGGGIWEWDGSTWTGRGAGGPGPFNGGMTMTYDAARHYCLLVDTNQGTWTWDGATWTQLSPATKAPKTYGGRLAFDSVRNKSVLFCAVSHPPAPRAAETWEWDGENWTQVAVGGPPALEFHGLVYDSNRGKAVLFGGADVNDLSSISGDTWEWDGQAWTQVSATGPSPRCYHAMSFDQARNVTVLFGGASEFPLPWHNPVFFADTWTWDGANWTQLAITGPSARYGGAMSYDGATEQNVLLGGTDQVFYYRDL